eukprot:scaffold1433_cov128-Skeletonema_dohrnii-CCMP3373.AAC.11
MDARSLIIRMWHGSTLGSLADTSTDCPWCKEKLSIAETETERMAGTTGRPRARVRSTPCNGCIH